MNSITPYLIAAAVLLPLLALTVGLLVWVQRHPQPDAARIKVLYVLLWFLLVTVLAIVAACIIFPSQGTLSTWSVLFTLASIALVAASISFQIRQCQRRLRRK
jgi:hypothetical protein